MAAMEVVLSTLIKDQRPPLTNLTGGTSLSNPSAGWNSSSIPPGAIITPATHGEKAGAVILTLIVLLGCIFANYFMWSTAWEKTPEKAVTEKGKGKSLEVPLSGDRLSVLPRIEERPAPIYLGGSLPT